MNIIFKILLYIKKKSKKISNYYIQKWNDVKTLIKYFRNKKYRLKFYNYLSVQIKKIYNIITNILHNLYHRIKIGISLNKKNREIMLWSSISITILLFCLIIPDILNKPIKSVIEKTNHLNQPDTIIVQTANEIQNDTFLSPIREARGVWMSRFDYTRTLNTQNPDSIKSYISKTFNNFKNANFNMIFFQVRGNGDSFYKSKNEPWSHLLTGELGKDPGWDPLAFAIKTAHDLGLELHAWVNVFPVWRGTSLPKKTNPIQPFLAHPEWLICDSTGNPMQLSNHYVSFSPGIPAVHDYIIKVFTDIIKNYDVDGIHFDYVRYPEGAASKGLSHDPISIKRFKTKTENPQNLDWEDWQREQITTFISKAYDEITLLKPWIKVSAAVLGNYNQSGWSGYSQVFQDARRWSEIGKIDMIIPMIYKGKKEGKYGFSFHTKEWLEKNSIERPVFAGIGVYRLEWNEILDEIDDYRKIGGAGFVMFAASSLNVEKLKSLRNTKFIYPAIVPNYPWKNCNIPLCPKNFQIKEKNNKILLSWDRINTVNYNNSIAQYIIFKSDKPKIDYNIKNILASISAKNNKYTFPMNSLNQENYYSIIAINRIGNESAMSDIISLKTKNPTN